MSFLLDLPEVVLNLVFKELDFCEIQTLRKVCRVLRNYIEDSKPDPKLYSVKVATDSDKVVFGYTHFAGNDEKKSGKETIIAYQKTKKGCRVHWQNRKKLLKRADYVKIAINDFKLTLRNQKSAFTEFEISTESGPAHPLLKQLGHELKSWPRPFQTQALKMNSLRRGDLFLILPHLDPEHLIDLLPDYNNDDDFKLELNEIIKLKQWKNLRQVSTGAIIDKETFFEHLLPLVYVCVKVDVLTARDACRVKEIFLQSPTKLGVCIPFNSFTGDLPFGVPIESDRFDEFNWFFRFPNSDKILGITNAHDHIYFMRIDRKQVPSHAIIQY